VEATTRGAGGLRGNGRQSEEEAGRSYDPILKDTSNTKSRQLAEPSRSCGKHLEYTFNIQIPYHNGCPQSSSLIDLQASRQRDRRRRIVPSHDARDLCVPREWSGVALRSSCSSINSRRIDSYLRLRWGNSSEPWSKAAPSSSPARDGLHLTALSIGLRA